MPGVGWTRTNTLFIGLTAAFEFAESKVEVLVEVEGQVQYRGQRP